MDDRLEDVSDCSDSDLESPEDKDIISLDRDEPVEVLRDGQWKSDRSAWTDGACACSVSEGNLREVWRKSLWREEFEDDSDRDGDDPRAIGGYDKLESAKE